jgi:diguanylate cyclase (GGDEF)-like protein
VVERALAAARRRPPAQGPLPRPLRKLVVVVLAGGAAVLAVCIAELAGEPLERADQVAVLAAGMLLAELFPLLIPGREEETSFSTAFSFALLFSHGLETTVVVATACVIVADLALRREPVKLAYNAAQYAISWAAAGVVFTALAGAPDPAAGEPLSDLWALVPAALVFALVNGCLGSLPGALIASGPAWPQLRHSYGFAVTTTAILLTLAPIVVVLAAEALWLVPLLAPLLGAIEIGSRQAIVNDARARLDPLTGAVTRRQLELELDRRLGEGEPPAVVVLDVAGFSDVNDALGHRAGDAVLRAVAERLMEVAGRGRHVARVGDDAFALVCDASSAEAVVERAEAALERPVAIAGLPIEVRTLAGIARAPAESAEALLRQADVALRAAKAERAHWAVYEPAMSADAAERLAIAPGLRRAIAAGELVLHHQPKLDLRTGEVAGVEALVRWRRPGHGLLPPDAFIDLAERTGLIRPLTLWVLRAAVADQAAWARAGLQIPVAVNLSARALHSSVVDEVALLQKRAAATGGLELEVTESAAMEDPAHGLEVLERLAGLGVVLSVDDFGTGHSSLAYLERLPVTSLKIDRSFVIGLGGDTASHTIVSTTVELGHRLGLRVVAEGVEDGSTLERLRGLGCDFAQGFGIAAPMPAEALPSWVRRQGALAGSGSTSRSSTSKSSS